MTVSPTEESDWAKVLKDEWNQRAQSSVRDFFVASGPGWEDPREQIRAAKIEVDFVLTGLSAERLARAHVLEIGCGTGRLVHHVRPRVADYTGVDISSGMCAEARRRCREMDGVRFFESDGLTVPAEALDRAYDLILAFAVFVHCPKPVIGSLVRSGWSALRPGGYMRFQVYADTGDRAGVPADFDFTALIEAAQAQETTAPKESEALIVGQHYQGHHFRFDEARSFFEELVGQNVRLHRPSPFEIWIELRRPTA